MRGQSRSNVVFALVAIFAIGAALWYRSQVFQDRAPTTTNPKLAFVTGGSGPYWQLTAAGARAAQLEYGCDLEVEMPEDEENLQQQMAILTQLQFDELDGVALSPLDADGQTPFINRVQQQTNVVTFDSDAPLSARRGHVGTSNYGAGVTCAELVQEALGEGGKVLVLLANLTKENLIDRKSGFEEVIRRNVAAKSLEEETPDLNLIGFLTDEGDVEKVKENIITALAEHPDLACIVGMNAMHGPIIVDTLKSNDRIANVTIVAFDEEEGTLAGIEAGHIYATIAQDPYKYGFETIRLLCSLHRQGGSEVPIVGGGTVNILAEPIRQENLQAFRDKLRSRTEQVAPAHSSAKP